MHSDCYCGLFTIMKLINLQLERKQVIVCMTVVTDVVNSLAH